MQRVQSKRPQYESKQWMQERQQHLKILMNISRFPEVYSKAVKKECQIVQAYLGKKLDSKKDQQVDQLAHDLSGTLIHDSKAFQDIQV